MATGSQRLCIDTSAKKKKKKNYIISNFREDVRALIENDRTKM